MRGEKDCVVHYIVEPVSIPSAYRFILSETKEYIIKEQTHERRNKNAFGYCRVI